MSISVNKSTLESKMKRSFSKHKRFSHHTTQFDYQYFKTRISQELNKFSISTSSKKRSFHSIIKYKKLFKKYITQSFSISLFSLINKMFLQLKLPSDFNISIPLRSMLFTVVKLLMMNEIEIVYLSLYLDKFNWIEEIDNLSSKLLFIGLTIKNFVNFNITDIKMYITIIHPKFLKFCNGWQKEADIIGVLSAINPIKINERLNNLKESFNIYCKNNFVDYNDVVDNILKMSIKYNGKGNKVKGRRERRIKNEEELSLSINIIGNGERKENELKEFEGRKDISDIFYCNNIFLQSREINNYIYSEFERDVNSEGFTHEDYLFFDNGNNDLNNSNHSVKFSFNINLDENEFNKG